MKVLHLLLLFVVFLIISYFLSDTINNKNNVQEKFLDNIFSKKSDNLDSYTKPLTEEQKMDNKSMNNYLRESEKKIDTPIQFNSNDMPISRLTPEQLEEREKIINDIKNTIKQKPLDNIKENPKKEEVNNEEKKEEKKEIVQQEKPKLKADQCRFLDSQSCNDKYPVFMGASISGGNNGLVCNDQNNIVKPEAMAQIENGEIKEIVLIKGGKGFSSAPKVIIKGDRFTMPAKAMATVNKDGEVDSVSVVSGGSGYVNTPKIEFEYDENNKGCYLCCRLDLFN